MPKIKIKVTVNNDEEKSEYQTSAIIQDEIIKYKEKDNTTVIYNYKKDSLFRENHELRMEYCFSLGNKSYGTVKIKELNKVLNIDIKTNKLKRNKNNIEVEYTIENSNFLYKIEEII